MRTASLQPKLTPWRVLTVGIGTGILGAVLVFGCTGCSGSSPAPYETFSVPPAPSETSPFASALVDAGNTLYRSNPKFALYTNPTASQLGALAKTADPIIQKLGAFGGGPAIIPFDGKTDSASQQLNRETGLGWYYLDQAFVFKIQTALQGDDFETALRTLVTATRCGLSIATADAATALSGYQMVDHARQALARRLPEFGTAQLNELGQNLTDILKQLPSPSITAERTKAVLLGQVDQQQNWVKDENWSALTKCLGPDLDLCVQAMKNGQKGNESGRANYFHELAALVNDEADWLAQSMALPAAKRAPEPKPKPVLKKPWIADSLTITQIGTGFLYARDISLARTRLLALTALLLATAKTNHALPDSIRGFPTAITIDPFSGQSFLFVAKGLSPVVYSVGKDLRDSGGETDGSWLEPDLYLEYATG